MASSILARLAVLISGDTAGLNKSIRQSEKSLGGFSNAVKGISGQLTAAIGALSFVALGKQILNITSEFQKFEAVLTNTLGSNSDAQRALDQIRDFAAKTPFSVQELTSSFVKLANQGFKPTADEMRRLGDLASSTGKNFDQLTEAIIDAQTGEFERLKEFGIRASKQGDQVKFTFKGVETQTKFTADSIRDYILSLGELEGVSGSMAAISETLGGKISNLGDAWDSFLLSLGTQSSGVAFDILDLLQRGIEGATDALTDDKVFTRLDTVRDLYVETAVSQEDIIANLEKLNRLQAVETKNYEEATSALGDFKNQVALTPEEFAKLNQAQSDAKEFTNAYAIATELLTAKLEALNTKLEIQALAIIPAITAEIKKYEELKNSAFDVNKIGEYNNKLKELKDELELINLAGSESGFLKNLNAGTADTSETQTSNPLLGAFPTELPVPNTEELKNGLLSVEAIRADLDKKEQSRFEDDIARHNARMALQQEQANAAAQYGDAIGSAFGDAASGQITFAQAAKRATAEIVKTLLARAMAGIIASAATSGGPPPVAIALAAAGVAAIGALFSKFVGVGGGGAAGGGASQPAGTNVSRFGSVTRPEDRITFDAKFEIEGNKLVAVASSANNKKQRTG